MDIVMTPIGPVTKGIDGTDEYVLLRRIDGDLTPQQAKDWLLPKVHREPASPGGYFCNTVRAVQAEHSADTCICTIQHRWDV